MRWVMLACVAGCGRIAFDPHANDAPVCTWSAFSAPQVVPGPIESPNDDWFPSPTLGETALLFHAYRGSANADLWIGTRPSTQVPFAAATKIVELSSTTLDDKMPTITEDGLDVVFARVVGGTYQLVEATRASTAQPFDPPVTLAINDPMNESWTPWISADGLRLVFSRRLAATAFDVFETVRPDRASPFAPPVRLVELASAGHDDSPTLSRDGLEIFFVSDRPGGPGGLDVYTARRPAIDQPFSPPLLVPEVSSPLDEYGVRLTPDGTTLYLNYDADTNGGANADFWTATRSCD